MESFFSRYRHGLFLIAVLLVQVLMLAVQVKRTLPTTVPGSPVGTERVSLGRYWGIAVFSPVERLINGTGNGIGSAWSNYIALTHTRQQNKQLQADLDRMRLEQASLADDARQAQQLQALLGFQQKYIYKTVAAQVLATSGTDQSRTFYIDKGDDAGLKPDMAVITPDGIVGKLREVYAHTSLVLEINDMTSGAGVVLETTRIRGVLRGNSAGIPQIIDVMPDDRIKPGEKVLTSGGDLIFPRGYPVGTVTGIQPDPEHDPYVAIIVKPAANLSQLQQVLVVTDQSSRMPPQMQVDLNASENDASAKRAADIVAERLPGLNDPTPDNAHPGPAQNTGIPPPVVAPLPLHPDHYYPGTVPPAADLKPGGPRASDSGIQLQHTPDTGDDATPTPASKPKSTRSNSTASPNDVNQNNVK